MNIFNRIAMTMTAGGWNLNELLEEQNQGIEQTQQKIDQAIGFAAVGGVIGLIIRIAIIILIIYVLYRFFKNIASIARDLHTIAGCMEATSENIYEVAVMLEKKEGNINNEKPKGNNLR